MNEYLSLGRYISSGGGLLFLFFCTFCWMLYSFLKEFDTNHPMYDCLASLHIGLVVGSATIFFAVPGLCFIRSIPLCYRVM